MLPPLADYLLTSESWHADAHPNWVKSRARVARGGAKTWDDRALAKLRTNGTLLVGATFAVAVLVAGCGSGKAAPTTDATTVAKSTRARSDTVRVYFRPSATRSQETSVGNRLRNESCVRRVVFVSKAHALKAMKKKFPDLFRAGQPLATSNPLPDSFTVTASSRSCVPTVGGEAAHWPGVDSVRWKT
jgi:cell division protein FtsX